jgi:CBS domain-containing protein
MTIGEICTRVTVFTTRETTVAEAAKLMRQHHVGSLVVVDEVKGGKRVPVGIVTDRDAVVEVMATGLDPKTITVGDIMAQELVTARESEGVLETMQIMRYKGVRRLPIVGKSGE